MSSDSGSTANFREMEDGLAITIGKYYTSLTHQVRCIRRFESCTEPNAKAHGRRIETQRKQDRHPSNASWRSLYVRMAHYCIGAELTYSSDMASVDLPWEVEGMISPEESISAMLDVIPGKGIENSGTFWTWENKVSLKVGVDDYDLTFNSNIPGEQIRNEYFGGSRCIAGSQDIRAV